MKKIKQISNQEGKGGGPQTFKKIQLGTKSNDFDAEKQEVPEYPLPEPAQYQV